MSNAGVLVDRDISQEVHEYRRKQRTDVHDDPTGLDIRPFTQDNLQPASYDLTLGNEWEVPVEAHPDDQPITLTGGLPSSAKRVYEADTFVLNSIQNPHAEGSAMDSGPFVLGHVEEEIEIPPYMTAEVKGRSSVGRLGVIPHTAGWGDPGFEGQLTLEFVNLSPNPIELEAGHRIAQVVFQYTNRPAAKPYGEKTDSKYQGQQGVTESRIEQDQ
jgi:deoxycytidine triphosphate deaminase